MRTILEESMGLTWATIERDGRFHAVNRIAVMNSDKVKVWTADRHSAQVWAQAFREDEYREWSPTDRADNLTEIMEDI